MFQAAAASSFVASICVYCLSLKTWFSQFGVEEPWSEPHPTPFWKAGTPPVGKALSPNITTIALQAGICWEAWSQKRGDWPHQCSWFWKVMVQPSHIRCSVHVSPYFWPCSVFCNSANHKEQNLKQFKTSQLQLTAYVMGPLAPPEIHQDIKTIRPRCSQCGAHQTHRMAWKAKKAEKNVRAMSQNITHIHFHHFQRVIWYWISVPKCYLQKGYIYCWDR